MLYYNFKNYEEFKELFGKQEHGNGVKSRKNKILLAAYKDKQLFRNHVDTIMTNGDQTKDILSHKSLISVRRMLMETLMQTGLGHNYLSLNGRVFRSPLYETDDHNGICEDGTLNAIRYVNTESGRVFKMKAGKMFNHLMENSNLRYLPEQLQRWLSEEFVADWIAYTTANSVTGYELHVDDNFSDIYDGDCLRGDFCSCMVDNDQWSFYCDAVKANAAYLTDEDDIIVARCIIFTDVKDQDGTPWRLAERQYSTDCDDVLKRILVDKLIQGGHIDGYKKIGAGCSDCRAFVDNEGNSLSDRYFSIVCNLSSGDTISYQDSFKWFDPDCNKAYNYYNGRVDLSTTDETVHFGGVYSSWHDEYYDEDDVTYVESRDDYFLNEEVVWCRNTRTYEFTRDCVDINGDSYYCGFDCNEPNNYDVYYCSECGEWFYTTDPLHSDVTAEYYCCTDCLFEAEANYKRRYWYWSEYDEEYFEYSSDLIDAKKWDDDQQRFVNYSISRLSLEALADDGKAIEYDGDWYIDELYTDADGDLAPAHHPAAAVAVSA